MNAETHKRLVLEGSAEHGVPSQARHSSPTISDAVNQRSCRKGFAGPQIAPRAQASGVFHFGIARCSFSFAAEQPGRRDEPARFQPAGEKFISRRFDSLKSVVVSKIVKLAFALRIEFGDEFLEKAFARSWRPFMKISVDDDLVSDCFQIAQPGNELSIFHRCTLMV